MMMMSTDYTKDGMMPLQQQQIHTSSTSMSMFFNPYGVMMMNPGRDYVMMSMMMYVSIYPSMYL